MGKASAQLQPVGLPAVESLSTNTIPLHAADAGWGMVNWLRTIARNSGIVASILCEDLISGPFSSMDKFANYNGLAGLKINLYMTIST